MEESKGLERKSFNVTRDRLQTNFQKFKVADTASLLDFNPKEKFFYLSSTAKDILSKIKNEIHVVSVSGSPLVGKSTLLNLIISHFTTKVQEKEQGEVCDGIQYFPIFTIGNGKKGTTQGIDIFLMNLGEKTILFCDVEGDNDPQRKKVGNWIYSNLISTATSISHCHIYNFNKLIQQTFIDQFRSVVLLNANNKDFKDLKPTLFLIKKNHNYEDQQSLAEDLQDIGEDVEEMFGDLEGKIQGLSLILMSTPPDHIVRYHDPESCLRRERVVCSDCMDHFFFNSLDQIFKELQESFNSRPGYKDGNALLERLEKILEFNKENLTFDEDLGYIVKIREKRFRAINERIAAELSHVEPIETGGQISKMLAGLNNEYSNEKRIKLFEEMEQLLPFLATKAAHLDYLSKEISRFVEDLTDPNFTILSNDEKEIFRDAYIRRFKGITDKFIEVLRQFGIILEKLIDELTIVKMEIQKNLFDLKSADEQTKKKLATLFVSSGLIGFGVKDLGVKVLASFAFGGGAVGALLTIYTLYSARGQYKKIKTDKEKVLENMKIEGAGTGDEAKILMQVAEKFFEDVLPVLNKSKDDIEDVCTTSENYNHLLTLQIEKIMDKKLNEQEIVQEDNDTLNAVMKNVRDNVEKLKKAVSS